MRTIKLTLEYDGTDYVGWQLQPNGRSIQGELEKALETLLKAPTRVHGSGRTDSGVHALGQVASFTTERTIPLKAFDKGLNSLLPRDIAVLKAEEAEEGFEARKNAKGKLYRYTILNRPMRSPVERRYVWEVFQRLDVEAMIGASRCLLGTHDFAAFRASDCEAKTTVRELRRIDFEREGDRIAISFEASGFMKHMIRNLVGTLVEVGLGKMSVQSVRETLESRERIRAGPTAPGKGLCLVAVRY